MAFHRTIPSGMLPSPGRAWWLIRRDWKRGPAAAWHDYVTTPKILEWRNPFQAAAQEAIPIHVLCGSEQFRLMLWMIASWFYATGRNWRVVVHDDGTMNSGCMDTLHKLLVDVTFIAGKEADKEVAPLLESYPQCLAYRRSHPLARKIFDIPLLAKERRILIFDTDLLFFKMPMEILRWVDDSRDDACWFNRDFQEPSPVPLDRLNRELGFPVWEKVNSGLCLLQRSVVDLPFCESVFEKFQLMSLKLWRVEQLLFALCASKCGKGGLLPTTYEVSSVRNRSPEAISRHYVGEVRDRFYGDGVRTLRRNL